VPENFQTVSQGAFSEVGGYKVGRTATRRPPFSSIPGPTRGRPRLTRHTRYTRSLRAVATCYLRIAREFSGGLCFMCCTRTSIPVRAHSLELRRGPAHPSADRGCAKKLRLPGSQCAAHSGPLAPPVPADSSGNANFSKVRGSEFGRWQGPGFSHKPRPLFTKSARNVCSRKSVSTMLHGRGPTPMAVTALRSATSTLYLCRSLCPLCGVGGSHRTGAKPCSSELACWVFWEVLKLCQEVLKDCDLCCKIHRRFIGDSSPLATMGA
jgi:hypothetical protein